MEVDIPAELRSGSMKRTHTTLYSDGKSSWNITVDIWSMLLPNIQVQQAETCIICNRFAKF